MCWILLFLQVGLPVKWILMPLLQSLAQCFKICVGLECLHKTKLLHALSLIPCQCLSKYEDTWTLKLLINKYSACKSHNNNSNKKIIRSIRHMMYPRKTLQIWRMKNPTNNPLSMIDNCREWFYNTCRLLDKRYQSRNRDHSEHSLSLSKCIKL